MMVIVPSVAMRTKALTGADAPCACAALSSPKEKAKVSPAEPARKLRRFMEVMGAFMDQPSFAARSMARTMRG